MSQPRLLLISPGFHGYWRSIAEALERRGYDVTTQVYDTRGPAATLRLKLLHELPRRLGLPQATDAGPTKAAIKALRTARADIVVAIRVTGMLPDFWAELSRQPRSVLWLYDEVRRTDHTAETLRAATAIATYSRLDAAAFARDRLTVRHVANAFDPHVAVTPAPRIDAVTFIGARYPNRDALLRTLMHAGVPVRAYGRDWSDHPFDRARTWRTGRVGIPNARDVPREVAYGVMQASTATLNMHRDQDGFTMRTFEAAGVGAVQLIDRADVSEFYEPGTEVAVFESPEEAVELARRAARDTVWANGIRERGRARTLAEHTFDHRVAELEKLWV